MPSGKPFVLLSAVSIALLTTGWNGFVLASPWTLAVAGLALLTGWLTRPDGE